MANTSSSYRYPDIPPVGSSADAGLDGLGINWNRGGEGLTPWVDYIRFSEYRPKYNGKAILESFSDENKGGRAAESWKEQGTTVFLYMPSNIAVSYAASYNSTKFGVGGIMAAQMLGSTNSEDVAKSLQNAAASATPEAGFGAVKDAANAISQFIGTEGGISSGSDLAAVTQGRIFNPYEEQIFNGITFRAHNFQFKLVARTKQEAEQIDGILKFFKMVMLPRYNSEPLGTPKSGAKDATSSEGSGTAASKLTPDFSNTKNRYLEVPSRVEVEFMRIQNIQGKLGQIGSAKTVQGLFKMKDCIIDGFQVNYTPDGGYVNTDDGYVPAIDINISLKEIALVTGEDIAQGF